MTTKSPSLYETAFDCPYCDAFSAQGWYRALAQRCEPGYLPGYVSGDAHIQVPLSAIETWRSVQLEPERRYADVTAKHVHISKCTNCEKATVWIFDQMVYPTKKIGPQPNPDLPEDIVLDYEEARSILEVSPRGAAALLRLAIQKLCISLGGKGKSIDADIGTLVSKGLSPIIQRSLDIVRVIGNEAVHPGVIDLRDNRETAVELFGLVNLVAQQMISTPKQIDAMYEKLPEDKRKGIEDRDGKLGEKPK